MVQVHRNLYIVMLHTTGVNQKDCQCYKCVVSLRVGIQPVVFLWWQLMNNIKLHIPTLYLQCVISLTYVLLLLHLWVNIIPGAVVLGPPVKLYCLLIVWITLCDDT